MPNQLLGLRLPEGLRRSGLPWLICPAMLALMGTKSRDPVLRQRCKDCPEVRGYPYKQSHLVALRRTKISASDPPSYWWPGER